MKEKLPESKKCVFKTASEATRNAREQMDQLLKRLQAAPRADVKKVFLKNTA